MGEAIVSWTTPEAIPVEVDETVVVGDEQTQEKHLQDLVVAKDLCDGGAESSVPHNTDQGAAKSPGGNRRFPRREHKLPLTRRAAQRELRKALFFLFLITQKPLANSAKISCNPQ